MNCINDKYIEISFETQQNIAMEENLQGGGGDDSVTTSKKVK